MALTITKVKSDLDVNYKAGDRPIRMAIYSIACTGTYATGGEAFDPTSTLGTSDNLFTTVYGVFCNDASGTGIVTVWDDTAKKLKMFYADYDAGADGVLIEFANGAAHTAVDTLQVLICGV